MSSIVQSVFYRYFFFDWLFKDVNRGSVFERSAAARWNKDHAFYLFTYLRRWAFLTVLFYLLGACFELLLQLPVVSAFFYVPSAVSIVFQSVIGVMIAWFKLIL